MRDPRFAWGLAAQSAPFVFLQMSKSDNFGEKMKEFMQKYDKNSDGKIEMAEVSPTVQAKSWGRGEGGGASCAVGKHPFYTSQ